MTTHAHDRSPMRGLSSVSTAALLLAATLVCGILVVARMDGMDAGPGTDLGGLGWYLGIWVTMMAAMMLPSVAPMVLLFARVSRERSRRELPGAAPTPIFVAGWRPGPFGAVRMGVEHGTYCIGCCWGLMVILFALGVMSLFWMAVITGVVFAEKILPHCVRLSRVFAVAFVAFGIWVALAPASVPGVGDPGRARGTTQMDSGMDGP